MPPLTCSAAANTTAQQRDRRSLWCHNREFRKDFEILAVESVDPRNVIGQHGRRKLQIEYISAGPLGAAEASLAILPLRELGMGSTSRKANRSEIASSASPGGRGLGTRRALVTME